MKRNKDIPDREIVEQSLSSLMDLELEQEALLPTIDHLVEDPELRHFWREGRALDALALDAASEPGSPLVGGDADSDDEDDSLQRVWSRIDQTREQLRASAAPEATTPRTSQRWRAAWSWAAAAAIVLAAGGGWWIGSLGDGGAADASVRIASEGSSEIEAASNTYVEMVVGSGEEGEGAMTERRFIELTAELLASDERYHRKMLEILDLVSDGRDSTLEGSRERSLGLERGDRSSGWLLEAADTRAGEQARRQL